MPLFENHVQWIIGILLIFSSLGIILVQRPVYASLCFLLTLLTLAVLYLQLYAPFIAVLQVLVYAGAILVIFMFVIILFQDAHYQIGRLEAKSIPLLLYMALGTFLLALIWIGKQLIGITSSKQALSQDYGSVQSLGHELYVDFFFPFEAVTLLFLVAVVGALYIARRIY